MKGCEDVGPWAGRPLAQTMMKSDEVEAMLHLHALGWGLKRIAREFGCSKNTVRRYVEADGWMTYNRRAGGGKLEGPGGVAEGALLPTPRQRGGGAAGPAAGAVDRREPAHGRARGRAVPAAADGRGEGDGAVRDAAGTSAADRFRAVAGADRRRAGARLPVRGDAGLFAARLCGGVQTRAPVVVPPRPPQPRRRPVPRRSCSRPPRAPSR